MLKMQSKRNMRRRGLPRLRLSPQEGKELSSSPFIAEVAANTIPVHVKSLGINLEVRPWYRDRLLPLSAQNISRQRIGFCQAVCFESCWAVLHAVACIYGWTTLRAVEHHITSHPCTNSCSSSGNPEEGTVFWLAACFMHNTWTIGKSLILSGNTSETTCDQCHLQPTRTSR